MRTFSILVSIVTMIALSTGCLVLARDGWKADHEAKNSNILLATFDLNHDGVLDASEIAKASTTLGAFDLNHDGKITADELSSAR